VIFVTPTNTHKFSGKTEWSKSREAGRISCLLFPLLRWRRRARLPPA